MPWGTDCRRRSKTWPRQRSWYRTWDRTWGSPFLSFFFHTLKLDPRQPNLLRNMSRRRRYPCERGTDPFTSPPPARVGKKAPPHQRGSASQVLFSSEPTGKFVSAAPAFPLPSATLAKRVSDRERKAGANNPRRSQCSRYGKIWKPKAAISLAKPRTVSSETSYGSRPMFLRLARMLLGTVMIWQPQASAW